MLIFLAAGTVSAQQAIAEVAKKVCKEFPRECRLWLSYGNQFSIGDLSLPLNRVRPSLIDSIQMAFVKEIPSAHLVGVVNRRNGDKDSLNYSLYWYHHGETDTLSNHIEPGGWAHSALFDNLDDKFYFSVDLLDLGNGKTINERCYSKDMAYDISAFEDRLTQLRKQYPTKTKTLKLKGNEKYQCDISAHRYEIKCDASRVFAELYDFVLDEYVVQHNGLIDIEHYSNRDYFNMSTYQYVDDPTWPSERDRCIGVWCENNKLIVIDIPVPSTYKDRGLERKQAAYINYVVLSDELK